MTTSANVFISYASDTRPLAEQLTHDLERQGIEPWVDFKDLRPGQMWKEELERAIDEARWVLILVGSNSRASRWQETEWSTALSRTWLDREKHLLPIVFGQEVPPPFLQNWVALKINPETESLTWTRKVIDVLRRNEAAHSAPKVREARRERLEEIRQAAEIFRQGHPDVPPTDPDRSI